MTPDCPSPTGRPLRLLLQNAAHGGRHKVRTRPSHGSGIRRTAHHHPGSRDFEAEKRRWLRLLGLAALATVIVRASSAGFAVLFFLPAPISSAHAAVAQTFFCIAVAIAVFTGPRWVEEQPRAEFDQRRPSCVYCGFPVRRRATPGRAGCRNVPIGRERSRSV